MKKGLNFLKSKRSQIAVFVIVAVVIVAGIAGFFLLKDKIFTAEIPSEVLPIYNYYLSCIKSATTDGASLLGTQAGYIELPAFQPGSSYAPFSNQLDFMGFGVPYWYYLSGNGIIKEQIPSKKDMQNQLNNYIEQKLGDCDFTEFKRQGYSISLGEPFVSTTISSGKIVSEISQKIVISKDDGNIVSIKSHSAEINSRLGDFYDIARKVYDYEKEKMFLENYAIDALNLYAPVTGTEISCSPITWNPYEVIGKLQNALQTNILAIKAKGDYYSLKKEVNKYFVVDTGVELDKGEQINFVYNPEWASRFEVWPTKGGFMIANPVGAQQGLGITGFCYVTYKFVYDMYFPVMIQIIDSENAEDIFQFPVAVIVSKNQPRESIAPLETSETLQNTCDYSNSDLSIATYNVNLEPVEANLEFKCFTDVCNLGKSNISVGSAVLKAKVPQCVNGVIIANAEGYKEKKQIISTNEESFVDIVLERLYNLDLEVYVDGKLTNNMAILTITENKDTGNEVAGTIAYPDAKSFKIAEGDYTFDLKVYTQKQVVIPETKKKICVDVPRSGILGVFGMTDEECFDYVIPSQTVSNMIYAGGIQNQYITPTELEGASKLKVYATSVEIPSSVEKIPETFELVESNSLGIIAV